MAALFTETVIKTRNSRIPTQPLKINDQTTHGLVIKWIYRHIGVISRKKQTLSHGLVIKWILQAYWGNLTEKADYHMDH